MGIVRLLLAISVVLAHSTDLFGLQLVGGQVAVQAFYIISGFYMALILNEKYVGINSSYKLFITNRLLRLYPVYWTVLILAVLASLLPYYNGDKEMPGGVDYYARHLDSLDTGTLAYLIGTNLVILFQDLVVFMGVDPATGSLFLTSNFRTTDPLLYKFLFVPQAWTLAVEITFYLIAPFIMRRSFKVILPLLLASLALRLWLYSKGLDFDPWTYRAFPLELLFFLLGGVAYRGYKWLQHRSIPKGVAYGALAAVLLAAVGYGEVAFPLQQVTFFALFFSALPLIFSLSKSWKWDSWIGELSYPVYISHVLVMAVIRSLDLPIIYSLGLTVTVATIGFSIVLNEVIAKRVERIRQSRVKNAGVVKEVPAKGLNAAPPL